jgi:hypothetical protein
MLEKLDGGHFVPLAQRASGTSLMERSVEPAKIFDQSADCWTDPYITGGFDITLQPSLGTTS